MPVAPPQSHLLLESSLLECNHFQSVHNISYYVFCSLTNEKSTSSSLVCIWRRGDCVSRRRARPIYSSNGTRVDCKQCPVENFVQNEMCNTTFINLRCSIASSGKRKSLGDGRDPSTRPKEYCPIVVFWRQCSLRVLQPAPPECNALSP